MLCLDEVEGFREISTVGFCVGYSTSWVTEPIRTVLNLSDQWHGVTGIITCSDVYRAFDSFWHSLLEETLLEDPPVDPVIAAAILNYATAQSAKGSIAGLTTEELHLEVGGIQGRPDTPGKGVRQGAPREFWGLLSRSGDGCDEGFPSAPKEIARRLT